MAHYTAMGLMKTPAKVMILATWLFCLIYLLGADIGAFWICLVFVPFFGSITLYAFHTQNIVLKIFCVLMFVGNAIGTPFFWLNRDNYSYSGFGAVKDFDFDLGEFFLIYAWAGSLFLAIVWCTRQLDKLVWDSRERRLQLALQPNFVDRSASRQMSGAVYSLLLVAFILLVMTPLSLFMSYNQIGTLGLESAPLPYRLTGILYYTRLYFGPALIVLLYSKTNKGWGLFGVLMSYALFAGLTSASRSVLIISLFPLVYFSMANGRRTKLVLTLALGIAAFIIVSGSRDFTFSGESFNLEDAITVGYFALRDGQISIFDTIGGIANRMFGPQDMVLAYQFTRPDAWSAMFGYFSSGGNAASVVPDMNMTLFGLDLEGTGFGVGIGTIAYLLILSRSNIHLSPVVVLLMAMSISFGYRLLRHSLNKLVEANLLSSQVANGPALIMIGGYMALNLYSSSLNNFYLVAQLLIAGLFLYAALPKKNRFNS